MLVMLGALVRNVTALTPGKAVPDLAKTMAPDRERDLEMYEGADDQLPKVALSKTLRHLLSPCPYHPMSHSTYVLCIPICWQSPIRPVNINLASALSSKHETRKCLCSTVYYSSVGRPCRLAFLSSTHLPICETWLAAKTRSKIVSLTE